MKMDHELFINNPTHTIHIICNGIVFLSSFGIAMCMYRLRRDDKEAIYPWLYWIVIIVLWVLGLRQLMHLTVQPLYYQYELLAVLTNLASAVILAGIFAALLYFAPRARSEKMKRTIEIIRSLHAEKEGVEKILAKSKRRITELESEIARYSNANTE